MTNHLDYQCIIDNVNVMQRAVMYLRQECVETRKLNCLPKAEVKYSIVDDVRTAAYGSLYILKERKEKGRKKNDWSARGGKKYNQKGSSTGKYYQEKNGRTCYRASTQLVLRV